MPLHFWPLGLSHRTHALGPVSNICDRRRLVVLLSCIPIAASPAPSELAAIVRYLTVSRNQHSEPDFALTPSHIAPSPN
jgi:hypothetical protein